MRNLYKDAYAVQDASNIAGVILSFGEARTQLLEHGAKEGESPVAPSELRDHPVIIAFVNKLEDMVHSNYNNRIFKAFKALLAERPTLEEAGVTPA